MEITREIALQIMSAQVVVVEPGLYKKVKVTNVSTYNPVTGEVWTWEESGDNYAIVNLQVTNGYMRKKAIALFKEGEYAEACNQNLSARVKPEVAEVLKATKYANIVVDTRIVRDDDGNEQEGLLITDVMPMEASIARRSTIEELEAMLAEEVIESVEAVNDVTIEMQS